jgi:hypothetical protein
MTPFEKYLINNGWLKYKWNPNGPRYEPTTKHDLSTLENIDHRYFHKTDPIINKIKNREIIGMEITREFRKCEIVVGLHEHRHQPTLIAPRPKGIERDYEMDRILAKYSNEEVLKAIFDKTIILLI